MELRSALATLDSDPGFAGWKSLHKDAYFSHAFTMLQDQQEDWQLGFYQHKDEKITKEWSTAGANVLFHAVVETAEIVG